MVEAAVFTDQDDDVLDRALSRHRVCVLRVRSRVGAIAGRTEAENGESENRRA
jgi:hypothetical protein